MAIEMRIEGKCCGPRVLCDKCTEPIEEVSRGIVYWYRAIPGHTYFVHKGSCNRDWSDQANKGNLYGWMPLGAFLAYLCNNTGYDPAKDKEYAALLSQNT
jgi:5-methylcytosine-specific restriction endonuclease McrA